ncbi:DUF2442 domain-containing protein [Treponema sp. UBA6852]|uniref:DUF2442 domain-containing protein n=1 Tax=Treponema sp. UBA6852 TaxID=1947744 RepID=UPI0025FBF822|nr:DUF2442 domain-containing protein [Treponema sp. UBA6852]
MNSGKSISVEKAVVTNISPFGIWLIASDGNEYFVSYKDYPVFENSDIKDIADVQTDFAGNLHWPALDADIELESLQHPEKFPLSYS